MSSYIVATGDALPSRTVVNRELAPMLGVTPEWIEANSGIRERRWAAADESASDLAAAAVRNLLDRSGSMPERVDYLVGCTLSPDYQVPGIAPLVQRKVSGIGNVPAVDLRVGCAAILYSLQLARALVESGAAKTVLCFGAEAQSKGLDLSNNSAELSMLFGDGAGALLVSRDYSVATAPGTFLCCPPELPALRIDDVLIQTDGSFAEDLCVRAPGTANGPRWFDEELPAGLQFGAMSGRVVILQAVRKLEEAALELLGRNGMSINDIDMIIPHQANANLLRTLIKRLSVSLERMVINLDRYGNTSSASAFIALSGAHKEGRLRPGSRVLFVAFGAGFTWGAALCTVIPEWDSPKAA